MNQTPYFAIVGIALLSFVACNENTKPTTPIAEPQPTTPVVTPPSSDGTFCFQKTEGKYVTEVKLFITGSNVEGDMSESAPGEHGAFGTLKGTQAASGEMELVYEYEIEGSSQKTMVVMKIENNELLEKVGELTEGKDGMMILKDPAKASFSKKMTKVECEEGH